MLCAGFRSLRVEFSVLDRLICILCIPVLAILHYVAEHILETEWVCSDFAWLLSSVAAVVHIYCVTVDTCSVRFEDTLEESLVREFLRISFEEVRSVCATSCCILPLSLGRKTVLSAGLE